MKAGRRANIQAQREPGSRALRRYCDAALVTAGDGASVEPAVGWLRETVAAVDIPPLAALWPSARRSTTTLRSKAARSSSVQGNLVRLTHEELVTVLQMVS